MVNVCMLTHSVVTSPLQPMNCSHTGPSIHEALHAILREVNGLPFPTPGDLPDPGMESKSPALEGGFFTTEPPGKSLMINSQEHLMFLEKISESNCFKSTQDSL